MKAKFRKIVLLAKKWCVKVRGEEITKSSELKCTDAKWNRVTGYTRWRPYYIPYAILFVGTNWVLHLPQSAKFKRIE